MKQFIIPALTFCALVAPALQAAQWGTNIPEAVKQAAAEEKTVIVVFTGSDWCPPCIALKKNVLSTEEFEAFAEDNLVLVELDFPRKKQLSAAQKQHNDSYAQQFKIEGFPTVIALDGDGEEVGRTVGGARSVDDLLDNLGFEDVEEAAEETDGTSAKEIMAHIESLEGDYQAINDYTVEMLNKEDVELGKDVDFVLYSFYIHSSLSLIESQEEAAELRTMITDDIIPYLGEDYAEATADWKEVVDALADEEAVEELIKQNAAE